jgi:hypothetical protein
MEEQTALHLLKDCSLFTKIRPAAFQTLTLPQIMQHPINTAEVSAISIARYRNNREVTSRKHSSVQGYILKGKETIVQKIKYIQTYIYTYIYIYIHINRNKSCKYPVEYR